MTLAALVLFALPVPPVDPAGDEGASLPAEPGLCDIVGNRGLHFCPAVAREPSKKERWLAEKARRPDVHLTDADLKAAPGPARRPAPRVVWRGQVRIVLPPAPGAAAGAPTLTSMARPGSRIEPVTTLYNVWTREALPVLPGLGLGERWHDFLRDHYTNQTTRMDERLVDVLVSVAQRFSAQRIEVVSGYRSPKYNLMLRKKGRQVARQSEHVEGNAVDFRIRGVGTKTLLNYVRSLRKGGVGFYPQSQFVHSDTGPIRYWTGS